MTQTIVTNPSTIGKAVSPSTGGTVVAPSTGATVPTLPSPPGADEFDIFEYQMPMPSTTATIDHDLGRDPVSVQVFVDGEICQGYGVYFTIPGEQVQIGFDIAAAALIRLH